jgi:hypothetical protein
MENSSIFGIFEDEGIVFGKSLLLKYSSSFYSVNLHYLMKSTRVYGGGEGVKIYGNFPKNK